MWLNASCFTAAMSAPALATMQAQPQGFTVRRPSTFALARMYDELRSTQRLSLWLRCEVPPTTDALASSCRVVLHDTL